MDYLRILHLAATTMESRVEQALSDLLASGEVFDYLRVRDLVEPVKFEIPQLTELAAPDFKSYDALLTAGAR